MLHDVRGGSMTHTLALLGTPELIGILVVCLLLFGATKLPKLARSMGRSVGEFKAGLKDQPASVEEPAEPETATADKK
jgi:sec-independent protein translocase protein TatA